MQLMVKKISSGICHAVHGYVKAKNKCMKDPNKHWESLYLKYWDENNLYGWEMS